MAVLLEDRLRGLADDVPLPDGAVADRIVVGVTDALRSRPPGRMRARAPRHRLGMRLAAGAALAVAVAGAIAVGGGIGGDGGQIDAAAAEALRRAAITAAHQPPLPRLTARRFYHFTDTETAWIERTTRPGSYVSCSTACPPPPSDWAVKARVVETWIGLDRSARVSTFGRPTFRSAEVRRLVYQRAAGSSQATDPGSSNTLAFEEFQVIGDLLRASPIRPSVRAALYTILSRMPGVTYDGRVTDPLGRPGTEVSIAQSSGEDPAILVFDPRTAQLLSEGGGGYSGWSIVGSAPR